MNASFPMLLPIHVAAGALAIVLGGVALVARKGGAIHVRAGIVFVYAMAVMGSSAAALGNLVGGLMPVYFVTTALTTVRTPSRWTRRLDIGALGVATGVALVSTLTAGLTLGLPGRTLAGVPFFMHAFLASVMMFAVWGDMRVLRAGALQGRPRVARHLWRMCFALFIAAGSFFSIRERVAKVLPEPFTTAPMRMMPIILIFVAMSYWLWRMRPRRTDLNISAP